ncbi:MAG: hypothetical protein C4523_20565 [Myxococcales bacterium]|nr:MAG: hypothetical protein C4523_20565 [Myxococcales bacterium]
MKNLHRTPWAAGLLLALVCLSLAFSGCSSNSSDEDGDTADGDASDGDTSDGDAADADTGDGDADEADIPEGPFADPDTVLLTDDMPPVRQWVVKRGIVHSHSPYSHDACDDEPFIDGVRNEQCFEDCRAGMCQTAQDFVFLSDHRGSFADYEFPEVLLYKDGDTLIERNAMPVANRVKCADGREVIVAAGTESEMMPIGLERHVGDTPAERSNNYGIASVEMVEMFREAGALVFLQHTEGWDVEEILGLGVDGIEMYNLHQNMMDNLGGAMKMVLMLESEPEKLPVMELLPIGIFWESEKDLYRWSKVVMQRPIPAVLATDAHRNVFKSPSPDVERIDSFRRMMHWFSNHLLVAPGPIDDAILKDTIKKGRMYGAFEYLGYPVGFDFHATRGDETFEMGDLIPAGANVMLHVSKPEVYKVDPTGPQPEIHVRVLKANDGAWDEIATGGDDLDVEVGPGVYRAEARINPLHLTQWLGTEAETYLGEKIWVYSNAIYVGMYE